MYDSHSEGVFDPFEWIKKREGMTRNFLIELRNRRDHDQLYKKKSRQNMNSTPRYLLTRKIAKFLENYP